MMYGSMRHAGGTTAGAREASLLDRGAAIRLMLGDAGGCTVSRIGVPGELSG
jgi:hypothetical protein